MSIKVAYGADVYMKNVSTIVACSSEKVKELLGEGWKVATFAFCMANFANAISDFN